MGSLAAYLNECRIGFIGPVAFKLDNLTPVKSIDRPAGWRQLLEKRGFLYLIQPLTIAGCNVTLRATGGHLTNP